MGNCLSYRLRLVRDQHLNEDCFPENLSCFSLQSLNKATNNFSTEFRRNRFSHSHMGTLVDGSRVVVKVYDRNIDFALIIKIMYGLKHRNVVELIGYCIEDDRRMLVHEFIGDYSLDEYLFSDYKVEDNAELDWAKRVSICHGIARSIDYLHNGASPCVVLRDVKPGNVFLDSNFNPKIVDFDIACLIEEGESHFRWPIAGTFGYLDPEYLHTGRSDVYAFGITLLEIITARKSVRFMQDHEETSMADWAWEVRDSGRIVEIVDPSLSEFSENELRRLVSVALSCTQLPSELRPTMSQVRLMLSDGYDFNNIVLTRPTTATQQWSSDDDETQL